MMEIKARYTKIGPSNFVPQGRKDREKGPAYQLNFG